MIPADSEAVAPTGPGVNVQDPRVTNLLRWSSGILSPLILMVLCGLAGLVISLRDGQRDLQVKVELIAESDKAQDGKDDENDKRNNVQDREIDRLKDRMITVQSHLGLR